MNLMDTQFELVDFSTETSLDIDSLSSNVSPFTFCVDAKPFEVRNWGDFEMDRFQERSLSITREEIPLVSLSDYPSRKTSIDIVPFVSTMGGVSSVFTMDVVSSVSMMDTVSSVSTMDTDSSSSTMDTPPFISTINTIATPVNIPTIHETPSDSLHSPTTIPSDIATSEVPPFSLPLSFAECVKKQLIECRARECRKRRQLRMEILRRKRQQGLISFDTRVRYEQRSEFAMKRVRSSGRFVTEIIYKSA